MITHCRRVSNQGEIHDGLVEMEVRSTWFGWHAIPPKKIDTFEFDHFTELGVAVYLESL
jgi:hypothetical protein